MQRKVVLAAAVTALVIILIFTLASRKNKYIPEPCVQNPFSRQCLPYTFPDRAPMLITDDLDINYYMSLPKSKEPFDRDYGTVPTSMDPAALAEARAMNLLR